MIQSQLWGKLPPKATGAVLWALGVGFLLGPGPAAGQPAPGGAGDPCSNSDPSSDIELCSDMVAIPGGVLQMGSATGDSDERPVHPVSVSPFFLDRYEVTRQRYQRCVAGGGCRQAKPFADQGENRRLPVVGVSWYDAAAFCRWENKRLPTEAEWEWAARGEDGRLYPWGSRLQCSKANFGNFAGSGPCAQTNPGGLLPVGSRPAGASPWGVLDLAGNVWEWVADRYGPYPSSDVPSKKPNRPAASPAGAEGALPPPVFPAPWPSVTHFRRVIRGGSCCSYFAMPEATNRLAFPADYVDRDIGFRCARGENPAQQP